MVNSTDTVIDIITLVKIFSRKNHCGGPSGDFVKTLRCNQKLDLKLNSPRSIKNNGYPNEVSKLATYLGCCPNLWQKCLWLVISLVL